MGGGRLERPLRKGKRRGSWGDSTEERRRAVRDKGRFGMDTSVQLRQDKVGVPGQGSGEGCEGLGPGAR